jgi:probable DNA metabolism protein
MIITYLYDGSFEGFLTCVYNSYYDNLKPAEIKSAYDYVPDLIHHTINIATDRSKADKVYEAIRNKVSEEALIHVFYVFLSCIEDSDTLLLNYIKLAFKLGSNVDMHLHNDTVLSIHKISRMVGLEKHRMLGFVRFTSLANGVYYAPIEPDHNILGLVAPHFASRLSSQHWIIHDIRRKIAAIYNTSEWVLCPIEDERLELYSGKKDISLYEELWKGYFENISIEERRNPRLQKRMMPSRYWRHLTELK